MQSRGFLFVATAAVLWAISGAVSKYLFIGGMDSMTLTKFRLTFSSITLLMVLIVNRPSELVIKKEDIGHYIFLGLAMASVQFSYLFAISKINVATAILLQYMSPVLIVCYFFIFKGIKPEKRTVLSIIMAITGCFYAVGAYNSELLSLNTTGIIGGLISACCFAIYSIKGESMMDKYSPQITIFYALLFGAIFILMAKPDMAFLSVKRSNIDWSSIIFISTIGTVVPFFCYFKGISIIGSVKGNTTATLEPIAAGIISFFLVGETMESLQILGATMVISAVILLQQKKRNSTNES